MGTKLYDDTKSALRELIQNSIDACLVAEALCNALDIKYDPEIIVRYYSENECDYLEVEDNGIGMNQEIIQNYYSNVGSSYYKSKDFYDLKSKTQMKFEPISRFGIGILSCFMVSDTIEVETRKLLDSGDKDDPLNLSIEGYDSIFMIKSGSFIKHGTKTTLTLRKKQNPWEKIRSNKFISYVKEAIPNPPVTIKIETDNNDEVYSEINANTFSEIKAKSLENSFWDDEDYIKEIEFDLSNAKLGLNGNVLISILEEDEIPVTKIEDLSRTVKIDDEEYDLESKIVLKNNEIEKIGTVIEVDVDSGISTSDNTNTIKRSKSRFSIHGIDYPAGIFPEIYDRKKKAKLRWPLPMNLVLDITGSNDLDLNSARTEIIYNKKWLYFEFNLANEIIKSLKKNTTDEYFTALVEALLEISESEILNEVLNKYCT
ncbi:ATP-binding protein [Marispirochaeta sp.]|uniref:ATP-binding protein n=1 Tax=Marispirochaeta sp. TaxID=2038653 RepID=UPI003748E70A